MDGYATHQRLLIASALQSSGHMVEMGCGDYSTPILVEIAAYQKRTFEVFTTDKEWGSRYESICRVNYLDEWSDYPYPKCGFVFLDNEQLVRDRQLHIPKLLGTCDVVMCHDFSENNWGAKYHTPLTGIEPPSAVLSNVVNVKLHDLENSLVNSRITTREDLANIFLGTGAELGVAAGDYSACILENRNVKTLYSIDRWSDHHDMGEYVNVLKRFSTHGEKSKVVRATFDEALPHFPDESLDFIYIDGYAHTGQEGGKTLEQWWSKLKCGGIFSGHDYHSAWPLTIKSVDEFASRHGVEVSTTKNDEYPSWFIKKEIRKEIQEKVEIIPNVACVYKTGGDYTADYVWRLYRDAVNNSARPIHFITYTDSEENLPGQVIKLKDNLPGWWSKLEIFREFNGRTVFLDLDTIITGSLEPLYEYDGPIALIRDFYDPNILSTGVMVWNSPLQFMLPTDDEKKAILSNPQAMDQHHVVKRLDDMKWTVDIVQDYISLASYKADCMSGVPEGTAIVCFHGKPRPHELGWDKIDEIFRKNYIHQQNVDKVKFSLLCPTRGRVKGAKELLDSALSTADDPSRVEVLFYVDSDDELAEEYKRVLGDRVTIGEPMSVSKSWNIIAGKCTGDILIMANDDIVYRTQGWETKIAKEASKFEDGIYCMWTEDGINGPNHCAIPIVSRKWYETLGYFTPGIFKFFFNDTWLMDIGRKVGRLHYIEDVLMEHLHFSVKKSEFDDTYKAVREDGRSIVDKEIFDNGEEMRKTHAAKLMKVMKA
jgi:glycosyl transferase/beta-hydroxylase protein BlmF